MALRKNVIACSSAAKTIDFGSSYGPIETVSIDALSSIVGASGLIHLAFITRDKLQQFGPESYIAQNRLITAKVADFIYNNPTIPILTTSSGAAAVFDHSEVDLYSDPYAALKQEEEQLWRNSAHDRLAIVFRVYAAIGRFIRDPRVFALSDFLYKAATRETIKIQSNRPVIRSYVHVSTMMRLFWSILDQPSGNGFQTVDAVMQTFTLLELAQLISDLWGLPEPIHQIDSSLPADNYSSHSQKFLNLLCQHSIIVPSISSQLQESFQSIVD